MVASLIYVIEGFEKTFKTNVGMIARYLSMNGYDVKILTTLNDDNREIDSLFGKIPLVKTESIQQMIAYLVGHRKNYDAILTYSGRRYAALLPVFKLLWKKKYFIKTDSITYMPVSFLQVRRYVSQVLRNKIPMRYADLILVESPRVRELTAKFIPEDRIVFYPNSIPLEDFSSFILKFEEQKILEHRKGPIILFAGRILYRKGLDLLIEAFSSLALRYCEWQLVIVGPIRDQGHYDYLRQLVTTKKLNDCVNFLGELYDEELYKWYYLADIFCLPARYGEGMPNAVVQAMFFRTAVIATSMAEVPYLLDDGNCGLLCEPGNLEHLVSCLEKVMADENLRNTLAAKARQRTLKLFTWEENTNNLASKLREKVG